MYQHCAHNDKTEFDRLVPVILRKKRLPMESSQQDKMERTKIGKTKIT